MGMFFSSDYCFASSRLRFSGHVPRSAPNEDSPRSTCCDPEASVYRKTLPHMLTSAIASHPRCNQVNHFRFRFIDMGTVTYFSVFSSDDQCLFNLFGLDLLLLLGSVSSSQASQHYSLRSRRHNLQLSIGPTSLTDRNFLHHMLHMDSY